MQAEMNGGMLNRNNFRSEEDFQRAQLQYRQMQRQAEQSARQRIWYLDIMLSSVYIFTMVVGLCLSINEENCYNFKTWLKVMVGFCITDLTISMNQLMFLKKKMHESIWLMLASLIMLFIFTCWYIYGNVIYYPNHAYCSSVREGNAANQTQTLWIMVLIGYMTMLKCCCLTSCIIYFTPIVIRIYRQQRNYGWEAAGPQLLNNLKKGKFRPEDFEEEGKECIICFVEFTPEDSVTTLPCNEKHIFHDSCIETWLRSNNSCPLCKAPITQEALDAQNRNNRV